MSKIHLKVGGKVSGDRQYAIDCWNREGLVPFVAKACTDLMVTNPKLLTTNKAEVTCKHCVRIINNG
jgi:hypothetical protein